MNKKMNKKFVALLMLLLIFTLTGCQLAREDGMIERGQDKLIGVYISYDYIDLFDFESYMNDNMNLFNGGDINIDSNSKEYERRMYAVQKDEVETASGGEKYTSTEFVFEEAEGMGMFSPTIIDPINNGITYTSSSGDEGISDVKSHIISGDNKDGLELEGTVYISAATLSEGIYINPVYQCEDGRVYLLSGGGLSASVGDGEGSDYTRTLTEENTIKENNKSKEYSTSIQISIVTMSPTKEVVVIQMDKDSNILKKDGYKPEDVPRDLKVENDTDYIIVESIKIRDNNEKIIEREMFSKNDQTLWFFSKGDRGIFIKTYSMILWD